MKKVMATVICLALLITVISGCERNPGLTGVWRGSVDFTDLLNEKMGGVYTMGEFTFQDICVDFTLTLRTDGTFRLSVEEESLENMAKQMTQQVTDGLEQTIEQMIKERDLNISLSDFLTMVGIDMDALVQQVVGTMDISAIAEHTQSEGKYEAKEGKLYFTHEITAVFAEDYYPYVLDGDTLTISAKESFAEVDVVKVMFPMVLTRVEETAE